MADAVWPAGLDDLAPQLVSWTKTEPTLTVRSQMDAGPDKVRRRLTAGVTTHNVELVLTRTQLTDTFRPFWKDTIQGGALTFQWRDWETQADADFRFIAPPVERPLRPRGSGSNDHWVVSFQLEQLPVAPVVVTPPAPGNDVPESFLIDGMADGLFWSDDLIAHQDTSYTPVPNDPDIPPSVGDYIDSDSAAGGDQLITVPDDAPSVGGGSWGTPSDLGPSDA